MNERNEPSGQCPGIDIWYELAARQLPDGESSNLVAHASGCVRCARLLSEAMEVMQMPPTEAEQLAISRLPVIEASKLLGATKAAPEVVVLQPKPRFSWKSMGAIAATLLVMAGVAVYWKSRAANDPVMAMAQAYESWRTTELRLPGAGHAPFRAAERGGADSPPARFDRAVAQIKDGVERQPRDARWRQAMARIQLLTRNLEGAAQSLQFAEEFAPKGSPLADELAIELAAVRFEQARGGRSDLYAAAFEGLSGVLRRDDNNRTALFNRAITAEAMFLFDDAIRDWERYLQLDGSSPWAEEARKRLAELRKRGVVKWRPPSSDPDVFLRESEVGKTLEPEIYLETAAAQWMSRLDTAHAQAARRALAHLAKMLKDRHGDAWLADSLRQGLEAPFTEGARTLERSIAAYRSGRIAQAMDEAKRAEAHFQQAGNEAAALRARTAYAMAVGRTVSTGDCLATSAPLLAQLTGRSYSWNEIQTLLEQSMAHLRGNEIGRARRETERAMELARKANYNGLLLRATAFASAVDRLIGDARHSWMRQHDGLQQYWRDARYPPMRAHTFYFELSLTAHRRELPLTALALSRAALHMIGLTENRKDEALGHNHAGMLAAQAGLWKDSESHYKRASELFQLHRDAPPDPRDLQIQALTLAEVQIRRGDLDSAGRTISSHHTGPGAPPMLVIRHEWLRALILGGHGDDDGAMNALWHAAELGEQALLSARNAADLTQWQLDTAPVYRGLVSAQIKRGQVEEAADLWQWYRSAGLTRQRANLAARRAAPPLRSVARKLEGLHLSFVRLQDGFASWAFDRNGVRYRWIADQPASIETAARRLSRSCANPESDLTALRASGRVLYEKLLGPYSETLEAVKALSIDADGALAGLPFEVLVRPDGQMLGELLAITTSPGLLYRLERGGNERLGGLQSLLAVGSPVPRDHLARQLRPIPEAEAEAREAKSHFPRGALLVGREATFDAVVRALPSAEVFHFGGHGLAGAGGGVLILAAAPSAGTQRDTLDAASFQREWFARCRLAVLSACSSGAGEREGPVNPESLVRAFHWAGVPSVAASRWDIDSGAARELMKYFYQNLASAQSAALALQAAAARLRRQSRFEHPYYWASFSMFGA